MAFNDKSGGPWGGGPENRNGPGGGTHGEVVIIRITIRT